jgi:hypothetical protein
MQDRWDVDAYTSKAALGLEPPSATTGDGETGATRWDKAQNTERPVPLYNPAQVHTQRNTQRGGEDSTETKAKASVSGLRQKSSSYEFGNLAEDCAIYFCKLIQRRYCTPHQTESTMNYFILFPVSVCNLRCNLPVAIRF